MKTPNLSSNWAILAMSLCFALAQAGAAQAGQGTGNGGDAVIKADGSVVLFDLFERDFDADRLLARLLGDDFHYPVQFGFGLDPAFTNMHADGFYGFWCGSSFSD